MNHTRWVGVWLGVGMLAATSAQATNGYFAHGYSVSQKALGGAGTALVEDAMIVTINPAGMVWAGDAFEVGVSLFSPLRDYTAGERGDNAENGIMTITPGSRESDNPLFFIPGISYVRRINDSMSWGISMYGNGGMNSEYTGNTALFGENLQGFEAECLGSFGGGEVAGGGSDNAGFCGGSNHERVGVDMAIAFIAPSFSMKLGDRISVGVAPIVAANLFEAQGLGAFSQFSNAPDKVSDNGHEMKFGGGYRIGMLNGLIPRVSVGLSYQSKIWMDPFEDYAGLFAGQGDFDVPETWNIGIAVRPTDNQRLVFDYQQINYSEITSIANEFDPNDFVNNCAIPRLFFNTTGGLSGSDAPSEACLGSAAGPGFGWQDVSVYKLGYQYQFGGFKFRAGYSWTHQPIPSSETLFNVLAPAVIEKHYTAGVSVRWSENFYIETALMYAPEKPVVGKNPLSNTSADLAALGGAGFGFPGFAGDTSNAFGPDPDDQDITINMKQYELTVGVAWRY